MNWIICVNVKNQIAVTAEKLEVEESKRGIF